MIEQSMYRDARWFSVYSWLGGRSFCGTCGLSYSHFLTPPSEVLCSFSKANCPRCTLSLYSIITGIIPGLDGLTHIWSMKSECKFLFAVRNFDLLMICKIPDVYRTDLLKVVKCY